jgi:hypothetical protein
MFSPLRIAHRGPDEHRLRFAAFGEPVVQRPK